MGRSRARARLPPRPSAAPSRSAQPARPSPLLPTLARTEPGHPDWRPHRGIHQRLEAEPGGGGLPARHGLRRLLPHQDADPERIQGVCVMWQAWGGVPEASVWEASRGAAAGGGTPASTEPPLTTPASPYSIFSAPGGAGGRYLRPGQPDRLRGIHKHQDYRRLWHGGAGEVLQPSRRAARQGRVFFTPLVSCPQHRSEACLWAGPVQAVPATCPQHSPTPGWAAAPPRRAHRRCRSCMPRSCGCPPSRRGAAPTPQARSSTSGWPRRPAGCACWLGCSAWWPACLPCVKVAGGLLPHLLAAQPCPHARRCPVPCCRRRLCLWPVLAVCHLLPGLLVRRPAGGRRGEHLQASYAGEVSGSGAVVLVCVCACACFAAGYGWGGGVDAHSRGRQAPAGRTSRAPGAKLLTRHHVLDLPQVFFSIFLAAMGAAQAQLFFPDVAKGKAATQRVFSIIDRVPKIDAASMVGLGLQCHCRGAWCWRACCGPAARRCAAAATLDSSVPVGARAKRCAVAPACRRRAPSRWPSAGRWSFETSPLPTRSAQVCLAVCWWGGPLCRGPPRLLPPRAVLLLLSSGCLHPALPRPTPALPLTAPAVAPPAAPAVPIRLSLLPSPQRSRSSATSACTCPRARLWRWWARAAAASPPSWR